MSTTIVQKSSTTATIVKLGWRFFTGAHLNGKTYNDSTWRLNASIRYRTRRNAYTWWRRKARWRRMAWRHSFFWSTILVIVGCIWSISSMAIILAALSPALLLLTYRKLRLALFMPFGSGNSDGSMNQHWMLKPSIRRSFTRSKRPGIVPPELLGKKVRTFDLPPDKTAAVIHELREELAGEVPTKLKLLMAPDDD